MRRQFKKLQRTVEAIARPNAAAQPTDPKSNTQTEPS
jgi:hypothetical protein